ncbi:hypothetical protein WH8501_28890 [Crocosphaera watsonii WH 8501]|uniref:hypothetical protein n=1 Tax=Crocosphaera watsonii TaxID=263511 RepID=UPI003D302097
MASHESFCKNLVDYFRQAALGDKAKVQRRMKLLNTFLHQSKSCFPSILITL